MKVLKLIYLLALIPTFLFSSSTRGEELYGLWYDDYSDTKLEIKHTRKGIKVKHHGGWFSKWRTYNYMGRGLYDDCDGKVIIVRGYDRIEWRKGRRRSVTLTRYNDYGGYDRYRDDRDYYSSKRSGNSNRTYGRDQYCGDWYCDDRGFNLSIESYGNGFRARFDNKWSYYEPYDDHFRDRRGNRYTIDNNNLTWRSYNGKKRLKFRKK